MALALACERTPTAPVDADSMVPFEISPASKEVGSVVYVSLEPGSVERGTDVTIRNLVTGASRTEPLVDGGLDPVPLAAETGHTLELTLRDGVAVTARSEVQVEARRPPRVVRTDPRRGKRDVALNATLVMVFSEPIDPATTVTPAIVLARGGQRVAGTVIVSGDGLTAEFVPDEALAPLTDYVLHIGDEVADLTGEPLDEPVSVDFTTSASTQVELLKLDGDAQTGITLSTLPAPLRVRVVEAGASRRSVIVTWTVTSGDGTLSVLEARTDSGGLASAFWTLGSVVGTHAVEAMVPGAVGSPAIFSATVVAPPGPVATVTVVPDPAVLVLGGLARLTTVLRDSAGREIQDRPVTWTTQDETIAAVDPDGVARAVGTGSTRVTATADGVSGNAALTVSVVKYASVMPAAYSWHTCGLTDAGRAYCWGRNRNGQLGDGTVLPTPAPVPVLGHLTFASITAGGEFACALDPDGRAFCWGFNGNGQLGNGGSSISCSHPIPGSGGGDCQPQPVEVSGGLTFDDLSAGGSHACGVAGGQVYCWGAVGDASPEGFTGTAVPTMADGGPAFVSVTAGGSHRCGLTSDGTAYCWGSNLHGQLGDGSTTSRAEPVPVAGGLTFTGLDAGSGHTCGVTTVGHAYCWGLDDAGQLGVGEAAVESCTDWYNRQRPCSLTPVPVRGGIVFSAISAGARYTCGVDTGGAAHCWGLNDHGQLGLGDSDPDDQWYYWPDPQPVAGGHAFASVDAGDGTTCGMDTAGLAYCWGFRAGVPGSETTVRLPTKATGQP